jgi:hypothetical protein
MLINFLSQRWHLFLKTVQLVHGTKCPHGKNTAACRNCLHKVQIIILSVMMSIGDNIFLKSTYSPIMVRIWIFPGIMTKWLSMSNLLETDLLVRRIISSRCNIFIDRSLIHREFFRWLLFCWGKFIQEVGNGSKWDLRTLDNKVLYLYSMYSRTDAHRVISTKVSAVFGRHCKSTSIQTPDLFLF